MAVRTFSRLALSVVALLAGLALPAQSASAAYPPGPLGPLIFVYAQSPTVRAGENFKVVVVGCRDGEICPVSFNPTVNAVGVKGIATATFRAPCKPGIYPIKAVVRGRTYTSSITVIGSCSGLPATGLARLSTTLSLGLGTLATGLVFFIALRSRHRMRLAH